MAKSRSSFLSSPSNGMNILLIMPLLASAAASPLSATVLRVQLRLFVCVLVVLLCSTAALLFFRRRRPVYLIDFSCYKPDDALSCSRKMVMDAIARSGHFTPATIDFHRKLLERSGLGDKTYVPEAIGVVPPRLCLAEARKEAEAVVFGSIDLLLAKATTLGINFHRDIGVLVVNCSLFSPIPSLSSMIVDRYNLRGDIASYTLGGMGCSAGLLSVDLAQRILQSSPRHASGTYALVMSTEILSLSSYDGENRAMLVPNCLFRMGGAAVLLSNRGPDRRRSKYRLLHTVRTHTGSDDRSFGCVRLEEDDVGKVGVSLSKDLMSVAGGALRANITALGPMVLPFSEQLRFVAAVVKRRVFRRLAKKTKMAGYVPDFKLAFEHFCVHAGGRAVLDELEKELGLGEWHMEPSRMVLYRFGNTSSSSLWYELAYTEAKGRVSEGDRVWQIGFGSGFKCNSAVWKALRTVEAGEGEDNNPWATEIDGFPVVVPKVSPIC